MSRVRRLTKQRGAEELRSFAAACEQLYLLLENRQAVGLAERYILLSDEALDLRDRGRWTHDELVALADAGKNGLPWVGDGSIGGSPPWAADAEPFRAAVVSAADALAGSASPQRRTESVLAAIRRRRQKRKLEQFAAACLRLDVFLQEQPDGPSRYGTLAAAATDLLERSWTSDDLRDLGIAGMRARPWPTGKARDAGTEMPDWVDDADALASDVERAAVRLRAR